MHLDTESVFFAPTVYAILRVGKKTLRKTIAFSHLQKEGDFKFIRSADISQNPLCLYYCFSVCAECDSSETVIIISVVYCGVSCHRINIHCEVGGEFYIKCKIGNSRKAEIFLGNHSRKIELRIINT